MDANSKELKMIATHIEGAKQSVMLLSQTSAQAGNFARAKELLDLAAELHRIKDRVAGIDLDSMESAPDSAPAVGIRGRDEYPKFTIEGNLLVKTGLQRDSQGTYQHRCPKPDFDRIVALLVEISRRTSNFDSNSLVNEWGPERVYLPRLVLEALVTLGVLTSASKGRYEFANKANFEREARASWARFQQGEAA